jgi:hypothetical protein
MMLKKMVIVVCCSLTFGMLTSSYSTNVSAQNLGVVIRYGPPEPRVEYRPQARQGYTWADGHWEARGRRHTWIKGYWLRNQRGYNYQQARWEQNGDQWKMHRGKWKRGQSDRDQDGVNDRNDRQPNNPRRH